MPTATANGKKFKFPEGTTPEQMGAAIDEYFTKQQPAPEQPAPEAPQSPPAADRGTTLSSVLGKYGEMARDMSPISAGGRALEAVMPEMFAGAGQGAADFQQGAIGGFSNLVEGGRQAFNKLTGDNEELAALNQDTEMRRAKLAEMTKQNPGLAQAGAIAGEAVPSMLAGGGLASALGRLGMGGGALAQIGGGAAAGAGQGYASALTPGQEAAGERSSNAMMGGALGTIGGALGPVIAKLNAGRQNASKAMLPKDALKDFLGKTLGTTDDTTKTYAQILGKTNAQRAANKNVVDAAYDGVLKMPEAQFDVPLHAMDRLTDVSRTPGTEELFNSSDALKHILNTERLGKTGQGGRTVPFPIMAQAVKDLNAFANDPQVVKSSAKTAEALARDLRERIDLVGDLDIIPNAKTIIGLHDQAQDLYKNVKLPMEKEGIGAPVGSWVEKGMTEKDFADIFMSDRSGVQLQDLFTRVPGVEDDVRKLWSTTKGAQPEISRDLASSTTRDVLFKDKGQREYASKIAEALRRGEDAEKGGMLQKLGYRMSGKYGPLMNLLTSEKLSKGVMPYGVKAKELTKADKLRAALMSSALLNVQGEE